MILWYKLSFELGVSDVFLEKMLSACSVPGTVGIGTIRGDKINKNLTFMELIV